MNKLRKKAVLYALLLSLTSLKLTGCSKATDNNFELKTEDYNFFKKDLEIEEQQKRAVPLSEIDTYYERKEDLKDLILPIPTVTANTNVNIRNDKNGEIIGLLPENISLKTLDYVDGWYQVDYYGEKGFVKEDFVTPTTGYFINGPLLKVCYSVKEVELIIPADISITKTEEKRMIPALECFEVYQENQDDYLVQTNDYIGYVKKSFLQELSGTFVVVDISNQELKLYKGGKVILDTPVVTGGPNTPTTEGLFAIYDISYNRYLIGPNYKTYVDIMLKFNQNEGLHDAEYHTNEDGFSHGWRQKSDFGGNTYLTNGSHGCVNMMHDDVFEISEYASIGTPVLIKK